MGRPCKWPGETQQERDAARSHSRVEHNNRKRPNRPPRPEHDNRKRPGRKRPGHGRVDRCFIAIDGEALGESGYHLLAASTGDQIEDHTSSGLSSMECLRFLLALKEKQGKAIYCGFALGYDCEHWIRDFGLPLWEQLRETGEGTVIIDGWKHIIQSMLPSWSLVSS